MAKFEIYRDAQGDFGWRFQANNGQILAVSSAGYNNRANCEHAILLLKQQVANAAISSDVAAEALTMVGLRA